MGKDGDPGGQAMNPKDPKMQAAKVRLLDGTHKDFELHRGSDGEALFVLVSADLSIEEREYFSLCFYDTEGIRHWLYNDKKILRQLKGLPWEFCFEVKFYPTVPSSLNDDHARYNLFLQLRNDVCSGRLPATIDTHATLGALVAQAQFGDAKQTPEYEEYLRTTKFAPQNSEQLLQMIAQKHKEYKGLTPAEAENLYMDTCKQQTMYGIFIFNAKDNKNVPVGIGICAHGIYIYKEQIRVNRFPWQGIIKISYRKNQFAVKLKAGEIDKKEATVVYKVSDYQHAKRIWKCAVEHHTFFRLIQPDEKPKSSLFRWGSARFRYQGRTQFQTKMASQMFDKPSTVAVQRTGSTRLTHSLDNVAKDQAGSDQVSPLHYADNELGSREPMASPAATYEVSGQSEKRKLDDKVGNGLPSGDDDHDDDDGDELVYTPVESPTSAAYYLSERSSTYSPTTSNEFCRTQMGHTSYHSWQSATEGSAAGSAGRSRVRQHRENGWEGSSAGPSRPSTLSSSQMDSTDRRHDIEQLPINDSVQVYHAGHYNHLENQPRPPPRNHRGAHNQRNGVTSVQRLGPDAEMDIHPIRYFVSMQHSGTSHMPQVKRIRHPGREETGKANLSDYDFRLRDDTPLQRLEPGRELTSHNIRQYSAVYHPGSSVPNKRIDEVSPPTRLIARVLPSSSEREGRETAPGVGNPPLSSLFGGKRQKKAAREEVPSDSQRKQKSLQKMGKENVPHHTGTRQNLFNGDDAGAVSPRSVNGSKFESSTTIIKTTTTKSEHKDPELHCSASTSAGSPLQRSSHVSDVPSATLPVSSEVSDLSQSRHTDGGTNSLAANDETSRRTKETAVLHMKSTHVKEKSSLPAHDERAKVRLLDEGHLTAIPPHEHQNLDKQRSHYSPGLHASWKYGDRKQHKHNTELSAHGQSVKTVGAAEDVKHGQLSHNGMNEEEKTTRSSELPSMPLREHTDVYHHGQSSDANKGVKVTAGSALETARSKGKIAVLHLKEVTTKDKLSPSSEMEKGEVRLIAKVPHMPSVDEPDAFTAGKDHESFGKKENGSPGKFAFWKSGNRKQRGEQAEVSAYPTTGKYAGPLDDVNRQNDIEQIPFTAPQPVAYNPAASTNTSEPSHRRTFLFGRWRHDGDEEVVEKDHVRPDTYGLASTSYEGPLENTNRSSELPSAPLREHSQAYHHGQSWDADKGVMATAGAAVETVRTSAKATVLNLKPDVRLGGTSRSTVEIRSGELDGKDRLQNSDAATPLQSVASANVQTPGQHSQSFFASRSDAGSVGNAWYLAKDEYGNDEPSLSERVTKAESSRDGKRYSSRFGFWMWSRNKNKEKCDSQADSKSFLPGTAEDLSHPHFDSERLVAVSNSHSGRMEGRTMNGDEWVEVRVDRRVEVQLEPVYCLSGAGLGALSEDDDGMVFSVTPPMMPSDRSFFSRFGFKSSAKKSKKQKKGTKETDSSDSSSSSDDEKNQVHVMSVEESGQPHTTISTWQESSRLPDEVTTEYDEKGNKITRTLKTSQVKHTVQKQTFQNYVVPSEGQPGVVTVERVHEETTPLGTVVAATNGSAGSPHVVETHSRSVAYDAGQNDRQDEGLGEFVSCKTLTSGNRTVETYTYKTERDGIIETHVEHRVTIHSDEPIDHDAELSQAIMEATQMNPDMTVEKIEVRQESTA